MPDTFIRVAEQSGLIKQLSEWVIDTACRELASLHRIEPGLRAGINLSMHNLHEPGLPEMVTSLLKDYNLPQHSLVLEITESVAMGNPQHLPRILSQLVLGGVQLSIDDFGTGYSSLSYLKKLPLSELKIDKSFVIDMDKDSDNEVIVRSTIDLAHNLGLRVVTEGVETQQILSQLQQIGADILQGYVISRPLPPEKFIEFAQQINQGIATGNPSR
jgi:EAL domain-containing protein (putative c-di-GMP-specific phosphodiesterase class I)